MINVNIPEMQKELIKKAEEKKAKIRLLNKLFGKFSGDSYELDQLKEENNRLRKRDDLFTGVFKNYIYEIAKANKGIRKLKRQNKRMKETIDHVKIFWTIKQVPLEPEYSKLVDDNFWELTK